MQDIVFYAAANETLGVVRDYANSRNEYAPTLVLGVSACLRMRLFAGSESAAPYPIASFSGITSWKWRMDSDFDRETPYKLNADSNGISVQTATDTIDGETISFTEFEIPISDMNTEELAAWLGTEKKKTGLTGELVGYDSSGNAVFVLQIDDFTVRNRIAGLNEPTSNDQEYLTRSETEQLVQTEIASAAVAKQDKLTSANAGAGIAIDSGGTISMACVILGATNGVKIEGGKAQFDVATAPVRGGTVAGVLVDVADGLLVAGGTASIDDASVADVLAGVEGGNASINDEVVTPGNLRGALSLGQAVDVSCAPYNNSGSISCTDDDFLQSFTCSMISGTTVGFYDATAHKFPKFATGLVYLFIADVSGSGTITPNGGSAVTLSETPQRITMKVTAKDTGYFSASAAATVNVANWRQYEVTALTDEAVACLAQLPNPDVFFRSTSVSGVLGKYLVRQDMVAPWIPTIPMPDNSDLTVASGLGYRVIYTDNSSHNVTVDTIPADAYGWDSHIQMFIKGASNVKFQSPLILMQALTSNAGHNLVVKYRNGQALVYVEDTDAGNVVISASGSNAGTLNYSLRQAPDPGHGNYIVFGAVTDNATCDAGSVSVAYNTNIIGNGTDKTSITGTYNVAAGKTFNMQDLSISGGTISGAGTTTLNSIELKNVTFANGTINCDDVTIPAGSTVNTFVGLQASGIINIHGNGGTIKASGTRAVKATNVHLDNIVITGGTADGSTFTDKCGGALLAEGGTITNCIITGNTAAGGYAGGVYVVYPTEDVYVSNCTIIDNVGSTNDLRVQRGHGKVLYINDSTVGACTCAYGSTISIADSKIQTLSTGSRDEYQNIVSIAGNVRFGNITINSSDEGHIQDGCIVTAYASDGTSDYLLYGPVHLGDDTTFKLANERVVNIDNCFIGRVYSISGKIAMLPSNGAIIVERSKEVWNASNVLFSSPLDTSAAFTVKLSGTTFTDASKIDREPMRIQLPASTTVSVRGNSAANATDKIITAPIIVVGDNASAGPNGSATIEYGTNNTSSISGLGTYIAKDGSNDFTTGITSVTTSDGLSAGLAGSNRWVKVSNGLTTSASYPDGGSIVDKRIITNEYEPVFGGDFSFSSGAIVTVDESTKTATVGGNYTNVSTLEIPKGATVAYGSDCLSMNGATVAGGGVITTAERVTKINTKNATISGITFANLDAISDAGYGTLVADNIGFSGPMSFNLTNCTITDSLIGGGFVFVRNAGTGECVMSNCYFDSSNKSWEGGSSYVALGVRSNTTVKVGDCYFGGSGIMQHMASNAVIAFHGSNRFESGHVRPYSSAHGSVTISSGAIMNLTGNYSNPVISCGYGVTFAPGGATVYPAAGSASAYMLGGMTVPQIGNTNVVDLKGSSTTISSGTTATANGCTFVSGAIILNSSTLMVNNVGLETVSGANGNVIINSGASVNLASSIVPGGGVTLYGGTSLSPTTVVCGGSSRIFEDVEIHGATITDQGIIYGATVYSNVGDDHYVYYTGDGGATSSSVIVTGQTEYVVPGGLVRIVGT